MDESLEEIKKKASYCLNCKTKPCQKGCPFGNDIPKFISEAKEGKWEEAYYTLQETTVLQPICGIICPHEKQCEKYCVRGIKGTPTKIGDIEAFIGKMAIDNKYEIKMGNREKNEKQKKRVAVIGSGPAGLTCSAFLAKKGYEVTIFEKHKKLGGLMRYGIPRFRLDDKIIDCTIDKILNLGINVVLNKEFGKDYLLSELQQNFDAVFISVGANISCKMGIPGEELNGVYGGNELLEYNLHPDYTDKKVAVIGGGNTAIDTARTVKRLGAKEVYIIYRRAEDDMPAERKEIQCAKDDGVIFLFQNNIVKINGGKRLSNNKDENYEKNRVDDKYNYENNEQKENNFVTCIECVKTKLVEKEGETRKVPINIENSNYNMDVDYVIMAIGAKVNGKTISATGIKCNERGYIEVDENYMTSEKNVFAGGDVIGGKSTVAWAGRIGRDVAEAISKCI